MGASSAGLVDTSLNDGIWPAWAANHALFPCGVDLVFASGTVVGARPSDAIALALRTSTPILVADEVLAEAGVAIPDEEEDEVERFREFLDQISPEDFGSDT